MISDVLRNKIDEYSPKDTLEQDNVLQEIMQHYILASLSRSGIFSDVIFHGGTCLRIISGTNRYSEDLDFLVKVPDSEFRWQKYLDKVGEDCAREGIDFELIDKSEAETVVQKAFLKTDSIGKILSLNLPFDRRREKKIKIKLEIDTNPPAGSDYKTSYITFPTISPLTTQTLESGFANKAHALLCRSYIKGRDWYDFIWYVSNKIKPNFILLQNAIYQQGPWAGKSVIVTDKWFKVSLENVVNEIDWNIAKQDIMRFLPHYEQRGIQEWSADFFLYLIRNMKY
ncbi:MAG: nucleotidyl transferase AbiEii/AbiGii toxin family protein [Spirochaetota bacterium]|nr:nucleotidyl transferase AbiEii/AbiGii toxin family protein [Spirochaetota bacterium]